MRPLLCLAVLAAVLCLMDTVDARKRRSEEFEDYEDDDFDDEDEDALYPKDESEEFENLSKKDRKKRIQIVFGKIDSDKDNSLSEQELEQWIKQVMAKNDQQELEKEWARFKLANDTALTWEVYAKKNKGKINEKTDKKKWEMADLDKDGKLSKGEFGDFLAPDNKEHMKDAHAMETFDGIDKDNDGYITKEEFLGDMLGGSKVKKQPKWAEKEMEKFNEVDTDKDGKVTFEQIRDILNPPGFNYANNEAKLLIKKADADKDGKLSLDEIIKKQRLFADSEATAHGEALLYHDEF